MEQQKYGRSLHSNKIEPIIREYCPVLTQTLTSDQSDAQLETDHLEPRQLGADNTRNMYTYIYGMSLNGYAYDSIASNVRSIFHIDIDTMDIHHIVGSIEFEAALASRTLLS